MRRLSSVAAVALGVALTATTGSGAAYAAPDRAGGGATAGAGSVVVMATAGHEPAVESAAVSFGGHVTRRLGIIDGFAANLPASAVGRLAERADVVSISPDRAVTPMSLVPSLGYDPADTGSLSSVTQLVGAQNAWAQGYTGQGVDVAVIDTGVAPVPGLEATGKVIDGPDLSFDAAGSTTPGVDAYGHGTFMASIIAGRDAGAVASGTGCTTCRNASGYSDTTKFVGVAPAARIINVKVGAADGATDVSQVIAAIDWVTQHAHDPGVNIRVLNLSFGTDSAQDYTVDPLAQAAEQAWKHGIVVVAAAGNDGKKSKQLADPAYDPYVLAVGADDTNATMSLADDVVASFAQHGNTKRPVDVIAPGTHVLGLRVPGSFVDTLAANTGQVGSRFQRGSGTSEAAAVVSGVAALLAQKYPGATPDTIKALLNATATRLSNGAANAPGQLVYWGHGIVNAAAALSAELSTSPQTWTAGTGSGTLDAARGGVYLTDNGIALTGQQDIFGKTFTSTAMAAAQASATAWTGGMWNGSRWTGDGWSGSRWTSADWTGTDWAGSRWTGSRWTGMAWTGSRWTGMAWDGSGWTGSGWTGSGWTGSGWTGTTWTGSRWSSAGWS